MELAGADSAERRAQLFAGFTRRNRLIGILRWGLPLAATFGLLVPMLAALVETLGGDFSIGRISIERDAPVVADPQYSGVTADGSTYKVVAESARAALGEIDVILLTNAKLRLSRKDGVDMRVDAREARLNTTSQVIEVPEIAEVADSKGSYGMLRGSRFDWPAMELSADGPVSFRFSDGTALTARGLRYNLNERIWQFTAARFSAPEEGTETEE